MNQNNANDNLESQIAGIETVSASSPQPKSPAATTTQKSKGALIAAIVFAVLAIGAGAFAIFELLDSNQKSTEIANLKSQLATVQSATAEEPNASDDTDAQVRELIYGLETSLQNATSRNFFKSFNERTPLVKSEEAQPLVLLDKSYGLDIYGTLEMDEYQAYEEAISNALLGLDFEAYSETADIPSLYTGGNYFINKSTNIVCVVNSTTIGCGHTSWLSENAIALTNELADAYYAKKNAYPIAMYITSSDIESGIVKDSSVSSYQTITTSFDNAAQLFFRTSPDADWQYFTGTQASLSCGEFDTDDLKNAFAGEICYDETIGENSTVQPATTEE